MSKQPFCSHQDSTLPLGERGGGLHPLHLFRFCPKCGSPRFVEHNDKSKHCEACGFTYYINPSAATVALIERPACQPLPSLTGGVGGGSVEWLCVRRAKEPAKGPLDLPVIREVKEETGLDVTAVEFLFSIPNQYVYSGFTVHTMDMFYRCRVNSFEGARAADDAGELLWLRPEDIRPEDFGLLSIRKGIRQLLRLYA